MMILGEEYDEYLGFVWDYTDPEEWREDYDEPEDYPDPEVYPPPSCRT